jgi:hypothetical protein
VRGFETICVWGGKVESLLIETKNEGNKMEAIKNKRVKVASEYFASGYGRGKNKRNVYEIDGEFYAYHPAYAESAFEPLEGELKGYIKVTKEPVYGSYHA